MTTALIHKQTLGILGGGQLGRMLVHAAQRMGVSTVVLEPSANCPAALASEQHIVASYTDAQALHQLQTCDAITTEFENVPAATLEQLAQHTVVAPPAHAVAIAQDRMAEKSHFAQCGVASALYVALHTQQDCQQVPADIFPALLKTARLGYDGKGQVAVANVAELVQAWQDLQHVPCVLEKRLPLAYECSVIIARNTAGDMVYFQPQRNTHHHGILATTYAFAGAVPDHTAGELIQASKNIAQGLDYVGVLCIEYFVLQDGTWVVNEMAPRPHNSGHYTIDACAHSQFDLQLRTSLGLPLPQPQQHSAAIMLNVLGDMWFDAAGNMQQPAWHAVQNISGVHVHIYGKTEIRPKRKMGHITITAPDADAAQRTAATVAAALGLPFEALPQI